jgi:hypothetical protein
MILVPRKRIWTPRSAQRGFFTLPGGSGIVRGPDGGGDPHFANVVALLHLDNNVTDVTGRTWGGSPAYSGSIKKYGTHSLNVNAANQFITAASSADFDFGDGDFTVECWAYRGTTTGTFRGILCRDAIGGTRGWLLYTNDNSAPVPRSLAFAAWSGATPYTATDSVELASSTWHHIAACRQGGTLRLYKDGVQVGTATIGTASVGAPSTSCSVGRLQTNTDATVANSQWNGYIDDVRITKGVCRYPDGTTFTPPDAPFPDS